MIISAHWYKVIIDGDAMFQEFRGALVENYVTTELARSGYGLFYWTSDGRAELDFLVQHDDMIYPLEIKSGNSGKKKSLRIYSEQYRPSLLLRTSPMNLKKDGNLLNCPLYLLSRLGLFLGKNK